MTFLLFKHADTDYEGYEQGEAHELFAGLVRSRPYAQSFLDENPDGCVYSISERAWYVLHDGLFTTPQMRDDIERLKHEQWRRDHPREAAQQSELAEMLAHLVSDTRYAMEPGVMQLLVQISPQSGQTLTIPKLGTIELEDNDNADD
jgi:hypothetical protein